jgi:hypothetical protein
MMTPPDGKPIVEIDDDEPKSKSESKKITVAAVVKSGTTSDLKEIGSALKMSMDQLMVVGGGNKVKGDKCSLLKEEKAKPLERSYCIPSDMAF